MNGNKRIWDQVKQPPESALKEIKAGRLKGKTDINPQWRYQAMTEVFGPCGIGWKYEIKRLWNEPAAENQLFAFAEVSLYVKDGESWSDPIPGIGGSMLIENQSRGPHSSDEAYKMATTDALSVSMKMLGVAADIYAGKWDGSKYNDPHASVVGEDKSFISGEQENKLHAMFADNGIENQIPQFLRYIKADSISSIPASKYKAALIAVEAAVKRAKK